MGITTVSNKYAITLEPNNNILKTVLNVVPNNKIKFTPANSIRTVLGFNAQAYSSGYNESEKM